MGPEKSVAPQAVPWKSPEKVIRCTQMEGLRKSPETSLRNLPQLRRFMASECKLVPLENHGTMTLKMRACFQIALAIIQPSERKGSLKYQMECTEKMDNGKMLSTIKLINRK